MSLLCGGSAHQRALFVDHLCNTSATTDHVLQIFGRETLLLQHKLNRCDRISWADGVWLGLIVVNQNCLNLKWVLFRAAWSVSVDGSVDLVVLGVAANKAEVDRLEFVFNLDEEALASSRLCVGVECMVQNHRRHWGAA